MFKNNFWTPPKSPPEMFKPKCNNDYQDNR